MPTKPFIFDSGPASFGRVNYDRIHVGKPLTNRKINEYIRAGRYTKQQPFEQNGQPRTHKRINSYRSTRRRQQAIETSNIVAALLH